ncbi:hypothetical protein BDZ45DRAFT_674033 [Acephala macrosclerotiorum]|nr:hypothetical protein BDZ45DRAFT_674033 [Acephala macrosclerotiorum]
MLCPNRNYLQTIRSLLFILEKATNVSRDEPCQSGLQHLNDFLDIWLGERGMGDFSDEMVNSEISEFIEERLRGERADEDGDGELPPLIPDIESSAKRSAPAKARSRAIKRFPADISRLSSLRRPAQPPRDSTIIPPNTLPPTPPSSPSKHHRRFKLEDLDLEVDGTEAERLAGAEARLVLLEHQIRDVLPVLGLLPGLSGMLDKRLEVLQESE